MQAAIVLMLVSNLLPLLLATVLLIPARSGYWSFAGPADVLIWHARRP